MRVNARFSQSARRAAGTLGGFISRVLATIPHHSAGRNGANRRRVWPEHTARRAGRRRTARPGRTERPNAPGPGRRSRRNTIPTVSSRHCPLQTQTPMSASGGGFPIKDDRPKWTARPKARLSSTRDTRRCPNDNSAPVFQTGGRRRATAKPPDDHTISATFPRLKSAFTKTRRRTAFFHKHGRTWPGDALFAEEEGMNPHGRDDKHGDGN